MSNRHYSKCHMIKQTKKIMMRLKCERDFWWRELVGDQETAIKRILGSEQGISEPWEVASVSLRTSLVLRRL